MFFYLIRQEEFKDGSGTRKSSSFLRSSTTNILPTLFASLVFLFLLGQVKGDDGGDGIPVGFFNHTLKDGMVTLSEGTVEVNETNLELFTNHSGACEVTFEGNFM
ncbi:unnamed protein product [Meloidogyne enterolobii]|uniref:Uncharacterized protein n=1 Tax=Meloidogyne enterolobii TaxID=390850 RepID=A0ACB0Y271_MELEN